MDNQSYSGYPFNLRNYVPVFDQGEFCRRELDSASTSWRSEKYLEKGKTNVHVFEYDSGQGSRALCDDEVLRKRLQDPHQPQLRIVLLQPTVQAKLAEKVLKNNPKAADLLLKNQLTDAHPSQFDTSSQGGIDNGRTAIPSQLNISLDALKDVLARYEIAPAACSHIRGQEQVYGSRLTKDKAGDPESLQFWYAIRARAFVPEEVQEADLKVTIITRYHFPTQTVFALIKHRSFSDLANGLKQELFRGLDSFIHHPSTSETVADPFVIGTLHFFPIIQYYRRAARGPRDVIRDEERKVHDPVKSKELDIRRLHLTLTSLDQDNIQLTFILGLVDRLKREHTDFSENLRRRLGSKYSDALGLEVKHELEKLQNYVRYFRDLIKDVAHKTERIMNLNFNLNARWEGETQHKMAETQQEMSYRSYQMAETQQKIAEYTVMESKSMSMIAVITMLFLPGTFVTSVLGSNFFTGPENISTDTMRVSSQVWILPTTIVALTVLVFLVFFGWRRYFQSSFKDIVGGRELSELKREITPRPKYSV